MVCSVLLRPINRRDQAMKYFNTDELAALIYIGLIYLILIIGSLILYLDHDITQTELNTLSNQLTKEIN